MKRILIIEDDRDIADLVRRYLEKAGFSVEVNVTGRDGMRQEVAFVLEDRKSVV